MTYADGGGVVHAARKPVAGRERVAKALIGLAREVLGGRDDGRHRRQRAAVGARRRRDGERIVIASITASAAGVEQILFVANPAKLKFPVTL